MQRTICFLRCIGRNDMLHHFCGYVGISNNNASIINNELLKTMNDEAKQWLEYDAIADKLNVHGGVTFNGTFPKNTAIIPIGNIPDNWHEYRYYGFDLDHFGDDVNGISTNTVYAIRETLAMQNQLEELIAQYVPSTGD